MIMMIDDLCHLCCEHQQYQQVPFTVIITSPEKISINKVSSLFL